MSVSAVSRAAAMSPPATTAVSSRTTVQAWVAVRVAAVEHPARDVIAITLAAADGHRLPEWTPGSHVDVDFGNDVIRQYSLCGDIDSPTWTIAVLLEQQGRGGSVLAHQLAVGDSVRVRGPRNNFALETADRHVFIAGGIGITPIIPMIRQVYEQGGEWSLHYGGRSRESMAFAEDLTRAYGGNVTVYPEDEVGRLDCPGIIADVRPGTLVFCCGPPGLLAAAEEAAATLPPNSFRVERFSADGQAAIRADDVAFEVGCTISGVEVTVGPDESILDALERAGGVVVASSCREGTCGSCETTVVSGVPDHRDSVLTADERAAGDVIMPCISRARCPRLELEL